MTCAVYPPPRISCSLLALSVGTVRMSRSRAHKYAALVKGFVSAGLFETRAGRRDACHSGAAPRIRAGQDGPISGGVGGAVGARKGWLAARTRGRTPQETRVARETPCSSSGTARRASARGNFRRCSRRSSGNRPSAATSSGPAQPKASVYPAFGPCAGSTTSSADTAGRWRGSPPSA